MTEYRMARPEEWEDCVELINYVFSMAHRPHDFEKLLPKVYQAGPEMANIHRVAADEKGRLRALVAVLPETVATAGKSLRAGYVGSVAVHPKARGEGHMKRLLADWIEELKPVCDLLVLDGQRQRYGYFGFEPGSMRYVFEISRANLRHGMGKDYPGKITFEPLFTGEGEREESGSPASPGAGSQGGDAAFAKELNERKPAYVVREEGAMGLILATFGQSAVGVRIDGVRRGYLLCHKEEFITEAAFSEPVSLAAVAAAYADWKKLDRLEISLPVYEEEQAVSLSAWAEDCRLERCGNGLYRILNYARVLEVYLSLKAKTMGLEPGVFSAVLEGQPVTARFDGDEVAVSREAGPDPLILNHCQAHELLLSLRTACGGRAGLSREEWRDKVPRRWFPLPVYWSMADEF